MPGGLCQRNIHASRRGPSQQLARLAHVDLQRSAELLSDSPPCQATVQRFARPTAVPEKARGPAECLSGASQQLGCRKILAVTDEEDLVRRLRVIEAGDDQVDQVIQRHQTTLVVHGAERQRKAPIQRTHQPTEVARHAGPEHKRWANDDDFKARLAGQASETQFGLVLRNCVGGVRRGIVVCVERPIEGLVPVHVRGC